MNNDPGLHDLIRQIGNGDPLALEALIAKISEPLRRSLSNRFIPPLTREDIEDVVQYTFIKVYFHARSYKGTFNNASARNWIFSIARHMAIRMGQLAKSHPVYLSLDEEWHKKEDGDEPSLGITPVSPDNTEEQAIDLILLEEFRKYFRTLPEREQEILRMKIDDFNLDQIGRRFQLSKARISQILTGIAREARDHLGLDE